MKREATYGTCRECGRPLPPSNGPRPRILCSTTCQNTSKLRAYYVRQYIRRREAGLYVETLPTPL